MKILQCSLIVVAVFISSSQVLAYDVFSMGSGLTSLEFVPVGNPGNAGELSGQSVPGGYGPDRICGAVSYVFNMGRFEVTAGQYTTFLNAVAKVDSYGLYNTKMDTAVDAYGANIKRSGSWGSYQYNVAPDWANRPVNYVSWGDAARFANWVTNGQPTGSQRRGTTEDGAYYLNGATSSAALVAVDRIADANRIPGKEYYFIPSEDEWYKAAYYDPSKAGGAGYWDYPTGSDSLPSSDLVDPDGGNNANIKLSGQYLLGSPYWRTEVGDFENSESPYGTFDQGGNVSEWNEALLYSAPSARELRGGSFFRDDYLNASYRGFNGYFPSSELSIIGFRVSEVPEPTMLSLLALGGLGLIRRRK